MESYTPSREEFVEMASRGNLVPVYREILADMLTPVSAYVRLPKNGYSFLLESVVGGENVARYSFMGSHPFKVLQGDSDMVSIEEGGRRREVPLSAGRDALHVLKEEYQQYEYVALPQLPRFCGGAVGYMAYDMVRFFEHLPDAPPDDIGLPDCIFMFTDTLLIFDHVQHRIKVLTNARIDGDPDAAYDRAVERIETVVQHLREPLPPSSPRAAPSQPADIELTSNFSRDAFEEAVERAKEYIFAGDIFQVVLSQRFRTDLTADPFDVYRALRSMNPSPYMYYLSFDDLKIVGSSPEILVTEDRGLVTSRPLAGTRRRGVTPEDDRRIQAELLADEKERAEHIMLVDLGRNDVGRVSRGGSVRVTDLMNVEKYSHVMHIYSHVEGDLCPDCDQFDVLRACFPAGTVSGAPKIRAMEIIDELEPTRRGPYAGAIGYFSFSGNMDTAITIRTMIANRVGDKYHTYVQAGAGIVADSVPEMEYQETVNKATALLEAVKLAEAGLE